MSRALDFPACATQSKSKHATTAGVITIDAAMTGEVFTVKIPYDANREGCGNTNALTTRDARLASYSH